MQTAVHVCNRAPKKALSWHTFIEALTGTILDVSYFRVFSCLIYCYVQGNKQCKLEPNAQPLVFVGYKPSSKGYQLWDKCSCKIVASTDVIFDKTVFLYAPIPISFSNTL